MHVAFPKETFDKLITYIGSKPFNEVENLINELKATVRPVNVVEPEPLKETSVKEGDAENVQSTQTESQQETQSSEEGGTPNLSQEPQNNQQ